MIYNLGSDGAEAEPQVEETNEKVTEDLASDLDDAVSEASTTKCDQESELCSLNSSEISQLETINFEAQSLRESEYHVFGLVCEYKYSAVLTYYRQKHRPRWMKAVGAEGGAGAQEFVRFNEHDDDVTNIIDIYCRILVDRGESKSIDSSSSLMLPLMNLSFPSDIFVLTTMDLTINDHCSRLMDASLQLLSTVRAMEFQLAKQKQSQRAETPQESGARMPTSTPTFSQPTSESAIPAPAQVDEHQEKKLIEIGVDEGRQESAL